MREVSSDLDLAQKPLGTQCRREFRVEDLDSDRTVVPKVCSQVHGRHATTAKRALDSIAVGEGGGESGGDFRHGLQDGRRRSKTLSTRGGAGRGGREALGDLGHGVAVGEGGREAGGDLRHWVKMKVV